MTDTVELPAGVLAEHVRELALNGSDPAVRSYSITEIDKYDVIREAWLDDIRYEDGDVHVWYRLDRREYTVHVDAMWGVDLEAPIVDIEVLKK